MARRPQLALIDELAHTNAEGSRHEKRWQDVEEVLAAGIDVFTTLNIQHIETLNETVARITGVRVRETVPDRVLEMADEIELIDIPPDELLERLKQGKVYPQDQAARALTSFFAKGNLTALRELALRAAADRVDAQLREHMAANAIAGPWPTQERILVCVNESPAAREAIRVAKRSADRARADWIALNVAQARAETHAGCRQGPAGRNPAACRTAGRGTGNAGGRTRRGAGDPGLCRRPQRAPHRHRPPAPAPFWATADDRGRRGAICCASPGAFEITLAAEPDERA